MNEVEVTFEREKITGIVPVGIYLFDAAKRLGVKIESDCKRQANCDACVVKILTGKDLLSEQTKAETEHLSNSRRINGERLLCQAKIEKIGDISVMTNEPKAKPEPTQFESFVKDFEKLPLNEKVGKLLELEQIALGDTINYILNLPYTIGGYVRDGLAEFGYKMEAEEKKAKRPQEHKAEESAEKVADEVAEPVKKTTRRKTVASTENKATTAEKKTTTAKKRTPRKPKPTEA